MLILGLVGGFDNIPELGIDNEAHDASAVLLKDGEVIAALEEERSSRIKHNGGSALTSTDFCLGSNHFKFKDIDKIVLHSKEHEANLSTLDQYIFGNVNAKSGAENTCNIIYKMSGEKIPLEKVTYVEHHMCHAANAYYLSGFQKSLILTIDGASPEGYSGYVISADGDKWDILDRVSNDNSLGGFYTRMIMFLGYYKHDEYKVMGLAPYGNPKKYWPLVKKLYTLLPDGRYKINNEYYDLLYDYIKVRQKGEEFTQDHKDLAATIQESLETIFMHILGYYQKKTGHTCLCVSGGVAHNCSVNGKVLYSGLFQQMYVQPAAHDGGNSLGGAIYLAKSAGEHIKPMPHLYLGTNISADDEIEQLLRKWSGLITFIKEKDIVGKTSKILADGYVVGWVQGKSEFGPRALGNRSILADPRPAENKTIINAMVKKREGYRPFAPSILEEYLGEYYELPKAKADLSFMNYVLQTRQEKQAVLGAVTHIDGSARIQTVSKKTNPLYWNLIEAFRKETGIPILLNTSFNNDVEPIVDTEYDALVCFLTTNINYLVIGNYLIEKKETSKDDYMGIIPDYPYRGRLVKSIKKDELGHSITQYIVRIDYRDKYIEKTTQRVYELLEKMDGQKTLSDLIKECHVNKDNESDIVCEIIRLWSRRVIKLDFK